MKIGETPGETARRELKEEAGLEAAELELIGIKHKMDYSKENSSLLEDKYFFVFKTAKLRGRLVEEFEGGKNVWLTKQKVNKLPNLFDGVGESIEMSEKPRFRYSESKYLVSGF